MNSSRYRKYQLKHLAAILESSPDEIEYIVQNKDVFYDKWISPKKNKTTGENKKYSDGTIKFRTIMPPKNRLKKIQKAINEKILNTVVLPENVFGGVKGKNNILNAALHKGNKYKLCTDLQDFYPSINNRLVYSSLLSLKDISNTKAYWLTELTTWKYQLPQGAPTSTHISNIVFLKTDKKLIEFSKAHNITYSRFIDDLSFSSKTDFRLIINDLLSILLGDGYQVNYRKTVYNGVQNITGIDVYNNAISAPLTIRIKAESELLDSSNSQKPYTTYINNIKKINKNNS